MARIRNPVLFSKHFSIDSKELSSAGLIDPFLNVDTQLFIDPVLLEKSSNAEIRETGYPQFYKHFENYVRLLVMSEAEGDAAWKAAERLLDLQEPPQTGLGYGGSSRSGSSRPKEVREKIMRTSKEIVTLGAKDPEMISLMGFFEDGVGPDTISDYTTQAIMSSLARITEQFCSSHGIAISEAPDLPGIRLPTYENAALVLVPQDIVRDLPIANDWSGIQAAVLQNARIRKRVNEHLGDIAHPTVADQKAALRYAALKSAEDFEQFLSAVKENAASYDPNQDVFAYYKLRAILLSDLTQFRRGYKLDIKMDPSALRDFVMKTIEHFKHHVERGNLWEELWKGDTPKKERAAQLIYFAIADCFCRANDIDVSPEANMGGGPVDFKFSRGYDARVLVEIKRSGGAVRHGYEKQLEIYKDAARTSYGIYVVMDFGDLGEKLKQIHAIQRSRLERGEPASQIVVIDATKKESASKRR